MCANYKVAALYENRERANFTKEWMEGVARKSPERPVSLMSLEARQCVDQAERRGLCYKKFNADITLECEVLPDTGTIISTGDLTLGILSERKRCWPECLLLQENLPCPLIDGVRYAYVVAQGSVCQGDNFKIVYENNSDVSSS